MRFLDLDLDFFLNGNAYRSAPESGRLGSPYRPWSASSVRNFLENNCGLSRAHPVPGKAVESHDGVFDFWQSLIKSGNLESPFEVVHVDAHPDLLVGRGMYLVSELLYIDARLLLAAVGRKQLHQGNYLTFALARGWIASLVWIPLSRLRGTNSKWDGDTRLLRRDIKDRRFHTGKHYIVPFRILPWKKFKAAEKFDYVALSRSPEFTPPESDDLLPVIEEYIKQV